MHPRNPHSGRYDFPQLIAASPDLAAFVRPTPYGDDSVDFSDPAAVKALNQALLRHFYGVQHWDIPAGYLCPPVPSRADYVHHVADLLADSNHGTAPRGPAVRVLDVGAGANCVYPLIGTHAYGWRFVGTDIDPVAVQAARRMVAANAGLDARVEVRLQERPEHVFEGVLKPQDEFDAVMCNPPFHRSPEEAAAGAERKARNLGYARPGTLNFGGQPGELWCEGGEEGFVRRMVAESAALAQRVLWFTTLISKRDTLPGAEYALRKAGAPTVLKQPMQHGQKNVRILAWTYQDDEQRRQWRARRWRF